MKILRYHSKTRLVLVMLILLAILIGVFIYFALQDFYSNHEQSAISIEEANSLAVFDICLPDYLPTGIKPDPYITYSEEFGDPIDSKVWVDYFRDASTKPAIRIYYIHNPKAVKLDAARSESARESAHYWLSFWAQELYETTVEDSQIVIEDAFLEGENSYWRFEIAEPPTLHIVLLEWTKGQVFYQLYSLLPLDETQKTADTIAHSCK